MDCKDNCNNSKKPETVPFFVYESEQMRNDKRFKKMWVALITSIALIFVTNAIWLWAFTSYDYVSYDYSQDGEGINIIGDENGVKNGAEIEGKDSPEETTDGGDQDPNAA